MAQGILKQAIDPAIEEAFKRVAKSEVDVADLEDRLATARAERDEAACEAKAWADQYPLLFGEDFLADLIPLVTDEGLENGMGWVLDDRGGESRQSERLKLAVDLAGRGCDDLLPADLVPLIRTLRRRQRDLYARDGRWPRYARP